MIHFERKPCMIHFEWIGKEGLIAKGIFESVTLPGSKGLFTVLKNHTSYSCMLIPGIIKTLSQEKTKEYKLKNKTPAIIHQNTITLLS